MVSYGQKEAVGLNYKLLVGEDDDRMREIICDYFLAKGFCVTKAKNGLEVIEKTETEAFDLVFLDIMMPLLDGYGACQKIRSHNEVPIVFITAKAEEEDSLVGYMLGADDYITKPFSFALLYAKAMALINRTKGKIINQSEIKIGSIMVQTLTRTVTVNERIAELSPKEYDLLLCLMENKNRILSRDQIIQKLWGYDFDGYDRAVDTHIKKLRAKLGDKAKCIRTVFKAGYQFVEDRA